MPGHEHHNIGAPAPAEQSTANQADLGTMVKGLLDNPELAASFADPAVRE